MIALRTKRHSPFFLPRQPLYKGIKIGTVRFEKVLSLYDIFFKTINYELLDAIMKNRASGISPYSIESSSKEIIIKNCINLLRKIG